ncbi:hypothetical protein ACRALDRAFT_212738, partial [Sodiomyces alcalophilus JCM 7366]|uniref:uncharacterized protein n=1 Tax=Sodiomyces alcalophilus JCM 7366 TaxID=591952 RepID=UPI0039B3B03D
VIARLPGAVITLRNMKADKSISPMSQGDARLVTQHAFHLVVFQVHSPFPADALSDQLSLHDLIEESTDRSRLPQLGVMARLSLKPWPILRPLQRRRMTAGSHVPAPWLGIRSPRLRATFSTQSPMRNATPRVGHALGIRCPSRTGDATLNDHGKKYPMDEHASASNLQSKGRHCIPCLENLKSLDSVARENTVLSEISG